MEHQCDGTFPRMPTLLPEVTYINPSYIPPGFSVSYTVLSVGGKPWILLVITLSVVYVVHINMTDYLDPRLTCLIR